MRAWIAAAALGAVIFAAEAAAPPTAADLASYTRGGPALQKPLIVNPGFENGAEGWPLPEGYRLDPTGGRNGTAALFYERADPAKYPLPAQVVNLQPGGRYRFGVWIKTENVANGEHGGATVCLQFTKGGKWLTGHYPAGVEGTGNWTRVVVAGLGPGASRALLAVGTALPLHSQLGKCVAADGGQYRFEGTDICADILAGE